MEISGKRNGDTTLSSMPSIPGMTSRPVEMVSVETASIALSSIETKVKL